MGERKQEKNGYLFFFFFFSLDGVERTAKLATGGERALFFLKTSTSSEKRQACSLLFHPPPPLTASFPLPKLSLVALSKHQLFFFCSSSRPTAATATKEKKMARFFSTLLLALVAALALSSSNSFVSADDGADCIEWANAIQEPASPCYEFGQSLRANAELLANGACTSFDSTGAKPTAACCDLATRLTACRCNSDLHQLTGQTVTFASYRSTMFYCHATCTDPVTC